MYVCPQDPLAVYKNGFITVLNAVIIYFSDFQEFHELEYRVSNTPVLYVSSIRIEFITFLLTIGSLYAVTSK
uniref:Uncharacterized protein n=1 Tax=Vespula pensylvanica TaxID=30213 RepID=A0A834UFP0_VESPE|nr:hypothetical protein H0235_003826 [Vespula pensylvanica]